MPKEFWLIVAMMFVLAVASIIVGWNMAVNFIDEKFTKEMREEAAANFRKEYFEKFVALFEERVEERALELAQEMIKEKENKDEGSDCS